ncbi:beta-ketoacyl synthase N-terminal-like domain-containing protein [Paenibacillus taiwanensis]|uniref:beta-ketoacyl synthase N-terminal-like domain-containing protein n=1 Tax=Paenibacillus taiwanensis TaxID=401638 RepID=UPI0003FEBEC0|nr:beta-ketoacyl synthase N-terminal-like domain-containing protein [Paenibacillus taiwanensis]
MTNCSLSNVWVTGAGITSAIGQGQSAFADALFRGEHAFGIMKRPGRQKESIFIGAELAPMLPADRIAKRLWRGASLTSQAALITLLEAWEEAGLDDVDPTRIGLIIGGSNVQQREQLLTYDSYADRPLYTRPTYALTFMDSDLCGICTEQFNIKGFAYTIGGASASGQAAVIAGAEAIRSGQADVVIALGALMDLSYLECQALRSLGAMGSDRYAGEPDAACRPFDRARDGFIYGEACGAIVLERAEHAVARGQQAYARIAGWGMATDGNRNPNPSAEGETRAVQQALNSAELGAREIDYINTHGTGSAIGDETELQVIRDCGLEQAYLNATKSITGHGLSAAGNVELVATLLQIKNAMLHPTRNLYDPIDPALRWVADQSVEHEIRNALSLSMGFGGMNTAVILQRL